MLIAYRLYPLIISQEFGFGLSYTTFSYSNLSINTTSLEDTSSVMETAERFAEFDGTNSLYDILFTASATITNSGNVSGSEVAQLVSINRRSCDWSTNNATLTKYISIPEAGEPIRMLRGFDKVKDLASGDSATATFPIRRKDVSVWNVVEQQWYVPNGTFIVTVGASSRILPLVHWVISHHWLLLTKIQNTTWTPWAWSTFFTHKSARIFLFLFQPPLLHK